MCNFKGHVMCYKGRFSLRGGGEGRGCNEPRISDRGPTTGSQSFCSRPLGIKTFIMLECRNGKEGGGCPDQRGCLIMQYGVGALRRYAGYATHTTTTYAYTLNPLAPPHLAPLAPLFLSSLRVFSAGTRPHQRRGRRISPAIEC